MAEVIDYPGTPRVRPSRDSGGRPESAEVVEAEVVEGEVVDERPSVVPSVVLLPVQVVRVVVQHEHTKTAGRHVAYVPLGAAVVAKRLWDSRTTARYERFMRAAEATGNHEAALEWEERHAGVPPGPAPAARRHDPGARPTCCWPCRRSRSGCSSCWPCSACSSAIGTKHISGDRRAVRGRRAHRRVGRHRGVRRVGPGPAGRAVDRPGRAVVDRPGARRTPT